MKKYLFIAASALVLASCSNDAYLGDNIENTKTNESGQILFASSTGKLQKDITGADAATKLGGKFYVLGTKGTLPATGTTTDKVFDNYLVEWGANTAGTTASNTDDWEYVGKTPVSGISGATSQTIKYWDYSASQYDFIAYSVGANTLVTAATSTPDEVQGTAIVSPTTALPTSFTLTAPTVEDLAECYYTDVTTVENGSFFGQPVTLEFKNLTAKVRVAFYETIPGYTVSNLEFYADASAPVAAVYTVVPAGTDLTTDETYYTSSTGDGEFVEPNPATHTAVAANTYWTLTTPASPVPTNEATLFVTGSNKLAANGAITVTYPVVGQTAKTASTPGYNKAFVSTVPAVTPTSTKTSQTFGNVNYTSSVLATTASAASMAGVSGDQYYTPVLPAAGQPLTLRVNYTLTNEDGNGETIKVWGATAVVPASYTAWQPNYAYTYIFKISDNSNGSTAGLDDSRVGLHPITFDAVVAAVADASDFNHESITTVSTPSVTSYAFNNTTNHVIKAYGTGNEYPKETTTDIYFSVFGDAQKADLNTKGQLYSLSAAATEAEVIDALQIQASTGIGTITGRNGLTLTEVATTTSQIAVPTDDGKTVTVSANSTAKVTASGTATYYAYVYDATPAPAPAATPVYTAVELASEPADWTTEGVWYNDHVGTSAMKDETFSAGTYYKKYSNTNKVYGVKVVHTY